MREDASSAHAGGGPRLQRAIVLALLGAEGEKGEEQLGLTREELGTELDARAGDVEEAVRSLHEDGVLSGGATRVFASRAARRLDELGLIAI